MKSWLHPHRWSITSRLVIVATVPVMVMFIVLATSLYMTGRTGAIETVRKDGQLMASALAETSHYGVVSGDSEALRRSMQHMLKSQAGISLIEIFDGRRQLIASVGMRSADQTFTFEQPITEDVPDIDMFDSDVPHPSTDEAATPLRHSGRVVGYVKIIMSAKPLLVEQRHRWFLNAVALLTAVALSVPCGLYLARLIRSPLANVMTALRSIRRGDLAIKFERTMGAEFGELQSTIEEMAAGLHFRRSELQREVRNRTEELQRAMERAQESDNERRRLIAHSTDLLEDERRRIARELHDQFNSSLLSIRMRASSLLAQNNRPLEPKDIDSIASSIAEEADQLYDEARRMLKSLRPEVLDTLGLAGAIREAVRTFNQGQTICRVDLEVPQDAPPPLSPKTSIAAYRVVQEALTNTLRHSHASQGRVVLRSDAKAATVTLEIFDNGIGFDTGVRPSGLGLLGMRERVEAVGGDILIQSELHVGTRLVIHFPIKSPTNFG